VALFANGALVGAGSIEHLPRGADSSLVVLLP
jgi:hypothetical protein